MPLPTPPLIETPRLLLRRVEPEDLPALLRVSGDDAVTQYLPYATWRGPDDAQAWFDRMQALQASGDALQLVVLDKATAQAIGTCLVFRHDVPSARAELGYVLGRAHWGRGLMHEALQALLAWALDAGGLRRLEAEVNPANTASVAVLQRLGFTQEGRLRQRWVGKGQAYDVLAFGLLRGEHTRPADPALHSS